MLSIRSASQPAMWCRQPVFMSDMQKENKLPEDHAGFQFHHQFCNNQVSSKYKMSIFEFKMNENLKFCDIFMKGFHCNLTTSSPLRKLPIATYPDVCACISKSRPVYPYFFWPIRIQIHLSNTYMRERKIWFCAENTRFSSFPIHFERQHMNI